MTDRQKKLSEDLVLRLWPDAGEMLKLSRNATYDAAKRGEIKTVGLGA
jgi:hypothetical protein